MVVPLYTRYVPPNLNDVSSTVKASNLSLNPHSKEDKKERGKKRKTDSVEQQSPKRLKSERNVNNEPLVNGRATSKVPVKYEHSIEVEFPGKTRAGKTAASPISTSASSREQDQSRNRETSNSQLENSPGYSTNDAAKKKRSNVEKARGKVKERPLLEAEQEIEEDSTSKKHSGVFGKYKKSASAAAELRELTAAETADTVAADINDLPFHSLEPIPLPERRQNENPVSVAAVLPRWLSSPITLSKNLTGDFENLGVDPTILKRLDKQTFSEALPVQSGSLPLLLPGRKQHPGDICISAATGSGKTMAYALPIVQSLSAYRDTKLRAVIVVPTRELVSQIQGVVQMCASGTRMKIGIAVGTQQLAKEQKSLMRRNWIYDPEGYEAAKRRRGLIEDFESYEAAHAFDGFDDLNEDIDEIPPIHHVLEHVMDIDILVCTPGRLVEHIKFTNGFALQDLHWLIIDEADRLLDQSFQEWVSILMRAIDSPRANSLIKSFDASPVMASVFDDGGFRHRVRKVILSATMTRDLAKLGSLNLFNPKLLVLEGDFGADNRNVNSGRMNEEQNETAIPSTLVEAAVPVGDGTDKPVYLLNILRRIFALPEHVAKSGKNGIRHTPLFNGNAPASDEEASSQGSGSESSDSSDSSDSSSDSEEQSTASDSDSQDDNERTHKPGDSSKPPLENNPTTNRTNVLIFANTNEAALRLSRLIALMQPDYNRFTAALTKSSTSKSHHRTLASFGSGKIRILIATDRASRGLDVANLLHVVNYDMPRSVNSYIHRVGRTARAGKTGKAWTLVEDRQAGWFWHEIARATTIGRKDKVDRLNVTLENEKENYEKALEILEEEVDG